MTAALGLQCIAALALAYVGGFLAIVVPGGVGVRDHRMGRRSGYVQNDRAEQNPRRPAPLDGVLVADFARVLAGPYATMLLGDLGATVIKVESPGGDDTRTWLPPEHEGVSTYYLGVNRNKRSVTIRSSVSGLKID